MIPKLPSYNQNLDSMGSMTIKEFKDWYAELETWNKQVFEEAVEVRGRPVEGVWEHHNTLVWADGNAHTHKALLINIQSIKEETAEDILRQIIYCMEKGFEYRVEHSDKLIQKAKAFLEKKK